MKKLLVLLMGVIFLSGCESKQNTRYVCNCDEKQRATDFVKESIKSSNNMSDEEMEDVIKQLEKTAIVLNCHKEPVYSNDDGIDWAKEKKDSCRHIMDYTFNY